MERLSLRNASPISTNIPFSHRLMTYSIEERLFHFKQPAGTSRGIYTVRRSWFVTFKDHRGRQGMGECAPLPNLSCDDIPDYATVLSRYCEQVCRRLESDKCLDEMEEECYRREDISALLSFVSQKQRSFSSIKEAPSMLFGIETALLNLFAGSPVIFNTPFALGKEGIPINGLVWMGSYDEMAQRMEEKLRQGFRCIKLKIGAIDFDQELDLLRRIRERFGPREVELRVDANGAFHFDNGDALYKLELLSQYALHSIEQPVKAGQWANMAELSRESPLPIALDEELIGINDPEQKRQMLNIIRPAYIVLKPSLHGGMAGCREWIDIARDMGIGSWITSALESNIGLNAIAQFCAHVYGPHITMPQGLGTGQLFTDNIRMPLEIRRDQLWISRNS